MEGIIVIFLFLWFAGKYMERPIDEIRKPMNKRNLRKFFKDDEEYLNYLILMEEDGHDMSNLL